MVSAKDVGAQVSTSPADGGSNGKLKADITEQ